MPLATDLVALGLVPEQAIRLGFTEATTAGAGTTQSGAARIRASLTTATTAVGQTAFILPSDAELMTPYIVRNTSATAALVFPPAGGAINASGANASVSVAQDVSREFYRASADRWVSFQSEGGGGQQIQNCSASVRTRFADRSVTLANTFFSALFRITDVTPNRMLKNPRVFIQGFSAINTGDSPTERIVPNDFKVAYGLEIVGGGARKQATFGVEGTITTRGGTGASKGWNTPFDVGVWSDPIKNADGSDLILSPGTPIAHCSVVMLALSTDVYPASQYLNTLCVCRNSTDPTAAALLPFLSNSSTISSNGSAPSLSFAPAMLLAEDMETGELISLNLTGDSRFYGVGDWKTSLPAGQYALQAGRRAMASLGYPAINLSIPGSTPFADCVHRYAAVNAAKAIYGRYCFNRGISNHGNNGDMSIGGVLYELDQLKSNFPDPDILWGKVSLPPRIGTGGDYRTIMGQTPAAPDTFPSGQRAVLNNYIMNNPNGDWDFVIDMGLYGSAAKDLPSGDPNFNAYRSRFPAGPSSTLGAAWNNNQQVFMADSVLQQADAVSMGPSFVRTNIAGPMGAPTDQGNGTWRYFFEVGSYPNTSYALGDSAVRVATGDGTHEFGWVSIIEAQAIIEAANAGFPARYPAA